MPTHARSYLAIRVSIDGNEGHGLVPGSPRSADTPRSNPALISLTTGPNCTRTPALQDQRLLAVLLQGKKKGKKKGSCAACRGQNHCLSTQSEGKAGFAGPAQPPEPPLQLEMLGLRDEDSLSFCSSWARCKSTRAPRLCPTLDCTPKAGLPLHTKSL